MEYKALAQNTYKFVTEHTFNVVGDISSPLAPMFGKVKLLIDGELYYIPIQARSNSTTKDESEATLVCKDASISPGQSMTGKDTIEEYIKRNLYYANPIYALCVVDGKKYFGLKNAYYTAYIDVSSVSEKGGIATINSPSLSLPSGKVKAIMYSASSGSIYTTEFDLVGTYSSEYTATAHGDTYYCCAYRVVSICMAKLSEDIVLGIEIEYPKYDITFSEGSSFLQYSLDDGVTFQDIPQGLALEQVEHIVLRNTSSNAMHGLVRTLGSGIEEWAVRVPTKGTAVFVPTANETLRVSWQ